MNGIQVEIYHKPRGRHVEVFLFERRGATDVFYSFHNGNLTEQEVPSNNFLETDIKPAMNIPSQLFIPLMSALTKKITESEGVNTEREDHLKGQLEATSKHLEDMRSMSDRLLRFVAKEPVKKE